MDLAHFMGGDLQLGPTGDIALIDGTALGQQRVLRRLLTNPGDYLWNLTYGAGLPQMIGQPANAAAIEAVIRSQIVLESVVAQTPAPVVIVNVGNDGTVFVDLQYADATTGQAVVLQFPVK